MFQAASNGQEELSTGGKALLDAALTENGDSILRARL
jgi:hypothetical protein